MLCQWGLDPTGELRRVNSSELDKLSCCSLGLSFLILGRLPLLNPRPALFQGLPPIELIYPTGVAKEIAASIMASWTALVKIPLNLSHIPTPLMLQCLQSLCLIQLSSFTGGSVPGIIIPPRVWERERGGRERERERERERSRTGNLACHSPTFMVLCPLPN